MQTNLFETSSGKNKKAFVHSSFLQLVPITDEHVAELFYSFHMTEFGEVLIASSKRRIHWVSFVDSWRDGLVGLSNAFPNVKISEEIKGEHKKALEFFEPKKQSKKLKVYPIGTNFQFQVWQALLKIPFGETMTYGEMAAQLELPKGASRAVGTAIGKNPIAYLIPCHRVLQASGKLGGYMWGVDRKKEILKWEIGKQKEI